jgi:DNA-binding response OmpR family regulator
MLRIELAPCEDARPVQVGSLCLDAAAFRASVAGRPLVLTYTEFQLLHLLVANRGRVLTRRVLRHAIWGDIDPAGLRGIDVHIGRLRTKLRHAGADAIETVRCAGYRIPR